MVGQIFEEELVVLVKKKIQHEEELVVEHQCDLEVMEELVGFLLVMVVVLDDFLLVMGVLVFQFEEEMVEELVMVMKLLGVVVGHCVVVDSKEVVGLYAQAEMKQEVLVFLVGFVKIQLLMLEVLMRQYLLILNEQKQQ